MCEASRVAAWIAFLVGGAVGGLPDEDDVDIGYVIQLMATALAHRDHGEPAQRGVGGRRRSGDGEGRAQGRRRQVGEFGGRLGDVGRAAHVAGGDGQQAAPVGDAQRHLVGGLGEPLLELLHAGVQIARLVRDEGPPVLRVPGQVVGERLGGTEHAEQPVAQRLRRDERVEQLAPRRLVLLRLDQPDEAEERQVRVGGAAERVQEQRVGAHGGQGGGVEQSLSGGRIGEAESQQPREGAAPAAARPPSPSCGTDVIARPPVRSTVALSLLRSGLHR